MISSLKRLGRGCAGTTASRSASVNSEKAMPSTSISTPAVTSAMTGCMCCGMPGVVCSAIAVHTVSMSCGAMPWPRSKVSRGVGAVYFEALMLARVLRGKTHVVEHGTGIKELGIETETPALAGERTPVIDAARVMEQQRRFRVPDEFRHLTRKLAVRDADSSDRDWRLRSPV